MRGPKRPSFSIGGLASGIDGLKNILEISVISSSAFADINKNGVTEEGLI